MAAYEEDGKNWPEIFVKVSGSSRASALGEGGRGCRPGGGTADHQG